MYTLAVGERSPLARYATDVSRHGTWWFDSLGFTDLRQRSAREFGIVLNPDEMMQDRRAEQQEQSNRQHGEAWHRRACCQVESSDVVEVPMTESFLDPDRPYYREQGAEEVEHEGGHFTTPFRLFVMSHSSEICILTTAQQQAVRCRIGEWPGYRLRMTVSERVSQPRTSNAGTVETSVG